MSRREDRAKRREARRKFAAEQMAVALYDAWLAGPEAFAARLEWLARSDVEVWGVVRGMLARADWVVSLDDGARAMVMRFAAPHLMESKPPTATRGPEEANRVKRRKNTAGR